MILTHDKNDWATLHLDTLCAACAVKATGRHERPLCGRISSPDVSVALAKAHGFHLGAAVRSLGASEVTVIGHGWSDDPTERFVWRGSVAEFETEWIVD